MEKEINEVEGFYQEVSDLLGLPNNYYFDPNTVGGKYRTRWNNRKPGNGRFAGYGLIRYFSATCIHVVLTNPVNMNRTYDSRQAALESLKKILDEAPTNHI
jgi:hypothetical protein